VKVARTVHRGGGVSNEPFLSQLSAAFYRELVCGLSVIFVFVQTREPYEVLVMPMERPQLRDGERQWRAALDMFDTCWRLNQWPELEPAALDDDPLMMNFMPPKAATRQRFEWPVGELAL
jgi:hypothetical protein